MKAPDWAELAGRATAFGFGAGWHVVRGLPNPAARAVFRGVADVAAWRNGSGVQQLRENLRRVLPRADDDALEAVVREAMRSYARYWREAFRLPTMDRAALYTRVDSQVIGRGHVEAALDTGRGVVIALPHSGNWDVTGVWLIEMLQSRGRAPTFATVAERLRPESLYEQFVSYRESLGFEVLPASGGAQNTVRVLAKRLRAGGVICLVADRDLNAGGIEVEFFGERTRMPAGPARLAVQYDAVLIPMISTFRPYGWGVRFWPHVPVPTRHDVQVATQTVADCFAEGIAEHPEDWHMLQPLWLDDLPAAAREALR